MPDFADFHLSDHGSLCILTAVTDDGTAWAGEHLPADAQTWAGGIVVERRHIDAILAGIGAAGLRITAKW